MGAKRPFGQARARPGSSGLAMMVRIVAAAGVVATAASAADIAPETIRLANDVVPAPFGYETIATKYVVAERTSLYISPYIYPGLVNNTQLKPGQAVEILAKAKAYDWILVGRNGVGIGYIPLSRLTPAKP